ncbi:hypothetical protein EDD16DRAFT_795336 [Pisolithus croceorrhizus]|nr:hypothetical protein EDD16DRAFT_795336 [Pisolithus croceorrhizus]
MALLQQDPTQYPTEFDYQSTSPSTKPHNISTTSAFDAYEFKSPPFHTSSYNGSYQNSPYSGHSDLSFDPDGPENMGLLGDELNGLMTAREDYDPSEYDPPNSSALLMFDGEFLDPNGAPLSVSVTPAPLDQHSPLSFDHSSPSSNDDGAPRSRTSSVSSNHKPQIHAGSSPRLDVAHSFEKLRFESPHWQANHLPVDRATSPPKKPQSPPQLLIPDSSPSGRPMFSQEPPLINAPEGDGGFMTSGPQLHIVPATPVSGGGAASQSVPFQSTLETLHQGSTQTGSQQQGSTAQWDQQQTEVNQQLGVSQFHEQGAQLFPHSHPAQGLSTLTPPIHSDATNTSYLFPNFPPRTRSKSDTSSLPRPQLWNTPLMTDQLNSLEGSALDTVNLNQVLPPHQPIHQHPSSAGANQTSFNLGSAQLPQFNFNSTNPPPSTTMSNYLSPDAVAVNLRRSKSDGGPRPGHNRLSRSEDMSHTSAMIFPPSSHQELINRQFLYPQETLPPIRGHNRRASSGSRGGDGSWSGLSSNRQSPYPSPSASPRVRYDDLPNVPLAGRQPSLLRPESAQQPLNAAISVTKPTVTSERTAGASHRRRKQEANFMCPVPGCGSTFTRSFNLKGHMRSHNEERPFQCKWPGCGKGFARQHDCKRHEQLHFNYRPFTCEGCRKTFARMDALNRHLRSEGGAECQRVLDAAKDSERVPVPKTEEVGWTTTNVMV